VQVQEEARVVLVQGTVQELFDATINAMSDATIVTVQYETASFIFIL
jgi:hypothetical protein